MILFRLVSRRHGPSAAIAFNGEGASLAHGRWHTRTIDARAVYSADSLALACLETLVHLRPLPRIFPDAVYYRVEVPDKLLERPPRDKLPPRWNAPVLTTASQQFGDRFLAARKFVGLVVPTVLQPEGFNVLINPQHPAFDPKWISRPIDYVYDGRLR